MHRISKSAKLCVRGILAALLATALLTACNTMKGAGKDVEDAGEGIQDAAD
jgi:predicted small secreted protein